VRGSYLILCFCQRKSRPLLCSVVFDNAMQVCEKGERGESIEGGNVGQKEEGLEREEEASGQHFVSCC